MTMRKCRSADDPRQGDFLGLLDSRLHLLPAPVLPEPGAPLTMDRRVRELLNAAIAESGIRAAQRDINLSSISLDIVAAAEARTGSLAAFPGPAEAHSTPDIAAASAAARARSRKIPTAKPVTAAEQTRLDALAADMATPKAAAVDPKTAQFARAIALERRLAAGEAISELDQRWLERFQAGPVYRSRKAFAEQNGLDAALAV